jgi:DNA adenine methylase
MSLLDIFESLTEDENIECVREKIIKAPFSYIGGKVQSVRTIIPFLPVRNAYIEPFGGSGVILLNRAKSKVEVYNDRFGGVSDFYRCIADEKLLERLTNRLELALRSRELFLHARDNWDKQEDIVERAALWYYSIKCSFSSLGRNFGRGLRSIHHNTIPLEDAKSLHQRLKHVIIENQDALQLMQDFDDYDAVFYLDPPYHPDTVNSYEYAHPFTHDDHRRLLNQIFNMRGFVAISGLPCQLYSEYPWDDIQTVNVTYGCTGHAFTQTNHKTKDNAPVKQVLERLWIKYEAI